MNKIVLVVIGFIFLIGAWVMRIVGGNSSHLSELREYWWIPLPLGLLCFLIAMKKK